MQLIAAVAEPAEEATACPHVAPRLAKLGRWAGRQLSGALKPIALKPRHFVTLLELRSGPMTQQSLGEALGVDATQLVGFLNELENEDLVRRRRDPEDRRRHIVEISESGCSRLAAADHAMTEIDARLMAGLGPEQQAQLITLLRFVAEHGAFDDDGENRSVACMSEVDEETCGA